MKPECLIEGCDKPAKGRGWCSAHYERWRKYGATDLPPRPERVRPPCSIEGCERPAASRGWCERHYSQWHRGQSPRPTKPRPTPAQRFWVKVDVRDSDECWNWVAAAIKGGPPSTNGRGVVRWRGRATIAYRIAWELAHGEPPPADLCVCHHCDNGRCCNPAHLFLGTRSDNMRDASRKGRVVNQFGPQRQSNYR